MRWTRCSRAAHVMLAFLMALFVACSEDAHVPPRLSSGLPTAPPAPPPPQPTSGTLRVAVVTTGAELAPYGYAVMIDGAIASLTAPNAVTTLDVAPGPHEVQLGGVPLDCARAGSMQRAVTVIAGRETLESFAISCTAPDTVASDTLPSVRVSVTVVTTGPDLDASGYYVGFERQPAGTRTYRTGRQVTANDSIVLMLPVGSFDVRLFGVAPNCSASQEFTRFEALSVDVLVKFTVTCAAIPDEQGVRVATVTTGDDPDTDGYTVTVANELDMNSETFGSSQAVGANGSVMVPKVPAGYYIVWLSGVAKNCIVVPSTSVGTYVAENQMSSVKFQVLCFTPR
jgi:hypothetical protein